MQVEVIPIISTTLSSLALFIACYTWKVNRHSSRSIEHYGFVVQADITLAENVKCLRFHGINPDTIEEVYGVTSCELSYLLQVFNSGSISNILSSDGNKKPFEKGSYWYDILDNEPTQKAFDLLKELFDSNNHFIARCKKTIYLINGVGTNTMRDKVE